MRKICTDLSTCTYHYYMTREKSLTWRKDILITSHTYCAFVNASHLAITFGICWIVKISLTYKIW